MGRILILDEDASALGALQALIVQARPHQVETSRDFARALETLAGGGFDLFLLDMNRKVVSGMEVLRRARLDHPGLVVIAITGDGDVEQAVESMKLGAYDYLCKPLDPVRLIASLDHALEPSRIHQELLPSRHWSGPHGSRFQEAFKDFVTQDRALMQTMADVECIARSNNNVVIFGETGTGKELVARAIHRLGGRSDRPLVAVSAAAFGAALFESQFFGHERGAFTGAESAAPGVFEEADGGTLFLDEIGDIELPVQSKLLRALQSGEYYRLGSTRRRVADVRLIAATNKDLEQEIRAGRFRADLFYRLAISTVTVPPLRERKGDVELLAYHFLDRHCAAAGKHIRAITEEVMCLLETYDFPGNLRELDNVIASAVALEAGDTLGLHALPPRLRAAAASAAVASCLVERRTLADMEADHIRAVIDSTSGNRSAAARILGISRMGLLSKLKRLGMEREPAPAGHGKGPAGVPG